MSGKYSKPNQIRKLESVIRMASLNLGVFLNYQSQFEQILGW